MKGVKPEAAVVLIVDNGRIVIIKRADRAGDPWTGQLGLPGGHIKAGESSSEAAVRECLEEVGIEPHIEYSLGVFISHSREIAVEAFFATGNSENARVNSAEVKAVFTPLINSLADKGDAYVQPVFENDQIWGLTYRIVNTYLNSIDRVKNVRK